MLIGVIGCGSCGDCGAACCWFMAFTCGAIDDGDAEDDDDA